MDIRLEANRRMWNERVPIHVCSEFYDVEGFKSGKTQLRPWEIEEVGDVDGLDLVHLQCHFGLDTLSWARLGARVWGVDFSPPAIDQATLLAGDLGLDAHFVVADIDHAVEAVGGREFDIVYTGLGALLWLPDVGEWARTVRRLLRPGGRLYLTEFHPFTDVLEEEDGKLVAVRDYAGDTAVMYDEPGTYADLEAPTTNNVSYEWTHTVSDVIGAVLAAGMALELFSERGDYTLFPRYASMARGDDGRFRLPPRFPRIPLIYSLVARRPG